MSSLNETKALDRAPGINGNRSVEVPDIQHLRTRLTSIRTELDELAGNLDEAAARARQGIPPDPRSVELLSSAVASFFSLRADAFTLQSGLGMTLDNSIEVRSLDDISRILDLAESYQGEGIARRERALDILFRIETIQIMHGASESLEQCKTRARDLLCAVLGSIAPGSHPSEASLAAGTHPLAALLILIQGIADPEEKNERIATVAESFGASLAIDATRGKLVLVGNPPPEIGEPGLQGPDSETLLTMACRRPSCREVESADLKDNAEVSTEPPLSLSREEGIREPPSTSEPLGAPAPQTKPHAEGICPVWVQADDVAEEETILVPSDIGQPPASEPASLPEVPPLPANSSGLDQRERTVASEPRQSESMDCQVVDDRPGNGTSEAVAVRAPVVSEHSPALLENRSLWPAGLVLVQPDAFVPAGELDEMAWQEGDRNLLTEIRSTSPEDLRQELRRCFEQDRYLQAATIAVHLERIGERPGSDTNFFFPPMELVVEAARQQAVRLRQDLGSAEGLSRAGTFLLARVSINENSALSYYSDSEEEACRCALVLWLNAGLLEGQKEGSGGFKQTAEEVFHEQPELAALLGGAHDHVLQNGLTLAELRPRSTPNLRRARQIVEDKRDLAQNLHFNSKIIQRAWAQFHQGSLRPLCARVLAEDAPDHLEGLRQETWHLPEAVAGAMKQADVVGNYRQKAINATDRLKDALTSYLEALAVGQETEARHDQMQRVHTALRALSTRVQAQSTGSWALRRLVVRLKQDLDRALEGGQV